MRANNFAAAAVIACAGVAFGGGGSGGGIPPALQDTLIQLMANPSHNLLIETDSGLLLGTFAKLEPVLQILNIGETSQKGVMLSADDLDKLNLANSSQQVIVNAINLQQEQRSYVVKEVNNEGGLILVDRRTLIRSEVKPDLDGPKESGCTN